MSRREGLRVLGSTAAVTAACVLPAFLVGAMAVQIGDDLGLSAAGVGAAVGAFFAAAALTSATLGRRAERLGGARGLRLAALGTAGTQAAVAGLARSPGALFGLLAVAGTANALAQPAANLSIARHLPAHRQGVAFAAKQSAIPLATFVAGLAVPALALTAGWRWAFVAGSLLALVSALVVADGERLAVRSRPGSGPRPPVDLRLATLARLTLGIGLGAASAGALATFLVSASVESGLAEGPAGLLLSLGSAIGITVRLSAGFQADRRGGGHLRVVALMLAGGAVAYGLLATGSAPVMVAVTPLAFGAGWAWPGLFNLAVVQANPSAPAAATGVTQTGTYLGAMVGPLAFGALVETASYPAAWLVTAAAALAGAAALWGGDAAVRGQAPVEA